MRLHIVFVVHKFYSCVAVEQWVSIEHGGSLYNGEMQVLYWADVSSEIAFVVPTASNLGASIMQGAEVDRLDWNISINSSNSSLTTSATSQHNLPHNTSMFDPLCIYFDFHNFNCAMMFFPCSILQKDGMNVVYQTVDLVMLFLGM